MEPLAAETSTEAPDAQAIQSTQDDRENGPQDDPQTPGATPQPDPLQVAISGVLSLPGPEAIRQVYQLAASAAKAKSRLQAAGEQLNARSYHDVLSQAPEVRYVAELMAVRQELDTLAGERRRLNLEAVQAGQAGNSARASLYEIQSGATTSAMEQVAMGVLLFLALPLSALDSTDGVVPAATPETSLPQEEPPQQ